MGIYDDPRAGVTNALMGQRQQQGMGPPAAGFNNGNSLYAGGAPPQGGFGMSNANSLQGGGMPPAPMGAASPTIMPQQPQMPMGAPFAQQQALQLPPMG